MPLETSQHLPSTRLGDVTFTMYGPGDRLVVCRVECGVLVRLARYAEQEPLDTFIQYRRIIEAIASRLYDEGYRKPFVTASHLGDELSI
jgi:hypothetical protein